MARHLAGKVARLISDFLTIGELTTLIEHEMEKRIVARHGLVKLDALLNLVARLKNDIRDVIPPMQKKAVRQLEDLIARLRKDLEKSDMATGRDALAAHALHLDLMRIIDAWKCMGETTYGVLASDLKEIDAELLRLASSYPAALIYPGASTFSVEQEWQALWRHDTFLGDPYRPRLANVYPGLGTAGIVAPLPGGHPAQDVTIRATGRGGMPCRAEEQPASGSRRMAANTEQGYGSCRCGCRHLDGRSEALADVGRRVDR
jgi:hypothetical protein